LREIREDQIRAQGEIRFRSEYHYAVFEYYRSAKVIRQVERAGVPIRGVILDAGCGSGGIAVSFAEECDWALGLDIEDRFSGAGARLAKEKGIDNVGFVQGDGTALPFPDRSIDLVLSHSVVEHVSSAEQYLGECHRVLKPGGVLFLSTPPYYSFNGSHLPRLKIPIPTHLMLPRRWVFDLHFYIARKHPNWLKEPRESDSFKMAARRGERKRDDLLQRVTVERVHRWLDPLGFRILLEDRLVTGFFRRNIPGMLRRFLEQNGFTQNVIIGNLEYVLAKNVNTEAS